MKIIKLSHENRRVLASLRSLIPIRLLDFREAMQIAELQAARLLELTSSSDWPIDSAVIAGLPRIRIQYCDLPTSGKSYWDGHNWVIALTAAEPATRQRFTLLHEYKHIIDHGSPTGCTPARPGIRQASRPNRRPTTSPAVP